MSDEIDLETPDRIFKYQGRKYFRPEFLQENGRLIVDFSEVQAIESEEELIMEGGG